MLNVTEEPPLLLTVAQAARRLSCSRAHLYRQLQRGALATVRIGGSRRVAVADLLEFIERNREEAPEAG